MTRTRTTWRTTAAVAALGLGALSQAGFASASPAETGSGVVFTESNAAAGNAVLAFERAADGRLTPAGTYPTGGLGTGAGLGSQGAVALDGRVLLAVNAGSDDVSVFRAGPKGLSLVDREASGGDQPISVTVHDGLVYVVNTGGTGNVSGFRLRHDGDLVPLANSTRPLSTDASGPAQVEFSPDGDTVVVTEKAANVIDGYPVRADGRLGAPVITPSSGQTPFGFAFAGPSRLVVTEAFGGAANASAASSYGLSRSGALRTITGSLGTFQTAACWVAVTGSGRYAYVANTGSNNITGYAISGSGALTRLDADGITATTGRTATDVALSRGSRYLYSRGAADGSITAFRVGSGGGLTSVGTTVGLPASAVGLVAR